MNYLNYLCLLGCLLLTGRQLHAQHQPTVFVGAGPNDAGLTAGTYVPLLKRAGFSVGVSAGVDYWISGGSAAPNLDAIRIAGDFPSTLVTPKHAGKDRFLGAVAGPQLDLSLGKNLTLSPMLQLGWGRISRDAVSVVQQVSMREQLFEKEIYAREQTMAQGLVYMPKLRLSVPLGKRFSVWAEGSYAAQQVDTRERTLQPLGEPLADGTYEVGSFLEGKYAERATTNRWSALTGRAGLSFALGKAKERAGRTRAVPGSGAVTQQRPSNRERTQEKKQERSLLAISPENNARYREAHELKNLTWQLVGTPVPNANYVVEVVRIDGKGQPRQAYVGRSVATTIDIAAFDGGSLPDGQYRWQVTEIGTGLTSDIRFFNISNCEIDLSIANETVECLGYEGEDRKYRICFDVSYTSPSGDLTYNDPTSGLSVYDQNYNPLSFTLVNPNTTLVTQTGATPSTVSYCVEVTVPSAVTAIGLGLQGDDLDPSPVLCQPGVSVVLDELPDCLCDACETMTASFDGFQVTPTVNNASLFAFDGSIVVNEPVYGVEIQVQSYSYTATPGGCSPGVTSVQSSGMIQPIGSTINGSGSLQANGPTKVVRYLDNTPLTGPIPVHLLIGLPGPLAGLDAECCTIEYKVCLKVSLFYEDGTCKVCTFTQCFQFDNQ